MRWETKAYQKYVVRLRNDDDADLIEFVEKNRDGSGTSEFFKKAIRALMNTKLKSALSQFWRNEQNRFTHKPARGLLSDYSKIQSLL